MTEVPPVAAPRRPSRFARLGPWCHDRRKFVLAAWILFLVLAGVGSQAVGDDYREDFNLPDRESKAGFDVLDERFGGAGTGVVGTIVFRAEQGVDDASVRAAMEALFEEVAALEDVKSVESPYDDPRFVSPLGEQAGKIAYANVEIDDDTEFTGSAEIRDVILRAVPDIEGLQVELGGEVFAGFEAPSSELLGMGFAIIILIVAFGSVLAMGLPLVTALLGIGVGVSLVTLLSNAMSVPEFATLLGVMIGLGVGIDYALLIVTRYREQLHAGHDTRSCIGTAIDTAGRSVLFAGTTVVISLLGLLVMGVAFVRGLAVAAAVVVALTVLATLTLLPALLGFAGERVERTRWRGLIASGLVAVALVGTALQRTPLLAAIPLAVVVLLVGVVFAPLKREVRHRPPKALRRTLAYRWSRVIQHRPWSAAVLGVVLLGVLALPVFGLRLGFSDESNFPEDTTTKQAYDLLVEGFGAGFNGPLLLVAEVPPGRGVDGLEVVSRRVAEDPGVVFASPPRPDDPSSPRAVLWHVVPTTGPQEEATESLVQRLRRDVLPPLEGDVGTQIYVTGNVPVNIDVSDYLAGRLPYFLVAVLALSFLLLLVVFRSLLVPLKAVLMNLLSIGAAYGVVVALFQWGWLGDLTGVEPAPIEPFIPMMLFAIVFGLSMDYEVFLLSRVREEWRRTGDSRTSVADGLAVTAKVITAAAAIMVVVFGGFVLEEDRIVKMMGVGLATAIFLDATAVRLLLVPATMELLGDRNWWLPAWLERRLPSLDVEGPSTHL